jgi:hypothetical protein
MPPILYFMLFTIYTCENFTDLHHNVAGGIVILFNTVSILVDSFLPHFNKSTYSCPVGVTLCHLRPLAYNILQSIMVFHNDVLLETFFQQLEQVQHEDCTGEGGNNTV